MPATTKTNGRSVNYFNATPIYGVCLDKSHVQAWYPFNQNHFSKPFATKCVNSLKNLSPSEKKIFAYQLAGPPSWRPQQMHEQKENVQSKHSQPAPAATDQSKY